MSEHRQRSLEELVACTRAAVDAASQNTLGAEDLTALVELRTQALAAMDLQTPADPRERELVRDLHSLDVTLVTWCRAHQARIEAAERRRPRPRAAAPLPPRLLSQTA